MTFKQTNEINVHFVIINFTLKEINCEQQGLFRGMKVEAEDTANKLICCATICQIKKDKLRIHFDGWGQTYDFWTTVSDNKIHFVGWCEEMGIPLCPPKGKILTNTSTKN